MDPLVEKFESLDQALRDISSPLLIIHPKPDADALGGAFAFSDYLSCRFGKNDLMILSVDTPGQALSSLFPIGRLSSSIHNIEDHDALIFLDRGDVFYKLEFDKKIELLKKQPKIINIDHHPHTFIPNALNIIDTKASATTEIIFRFFEHVQYDFDAKIAQYLLSGIYTDTGGFRHNNTSPETLEISGSLLRKGASITKINRALFTNKSLNTLRLWGIALERAKINIRTGMAVSFITKEDIKRCGATTEDISGISEILNTISNSKFSLILSEREKNKVKASLRSDEHKKVDVSKIARQFQGGGHKLASGFEIKGRLRQIGDSWIIE
ncbi:MAG: bifunctional oligoribonuclease/PAP phosphatase NrnA [Patescibacteria group bacterium]|nr:bifunctional oligoribonuclease/PAP phosphatase NrnA [Patescibacteria group bacterium]